MKRGVFIFFCCFLSCTDQPGSSLAWTDPIEAKPHTSYSSGESPYLNFNSVKAVNRIADMENHYFERYSDSVSLFYGTVWREGAEQIMLDNGISLYEDYLNQLNPASGAPDSLHCTLYAYESLKAGLSGEQLNQLENHHHKIWKNREIAGWSIGYLLTEYFDWEAYLMIRPNSSEFEHCMKSYRRDQTYPVWRQPNIPLQDVFIIGQQDSLIQALLAQHEFGWGFSHQGIHTWITRFTDLKECNWSGPPALKYQYYSEDKPLFLSTPFQDFFDYDSQVVLFPKKIPLND